MDNPIYINVVLGHADFWSVNFSSMRKAHDIEDLYLVVVWVWLYATCVRALIIVNCPVRLADCWVDFPCININDSWDDVISLFVAYIYCISIFLVVVELSVSIGYVVSFLCVVWPRLQWNRGVCIVFCIWFWLLPVLIDASRGGCYRSASSHFVYCVFWAYVFFGSCISASKRQAGEGVSSVPLSSCLLRTFRVNPSCEPCAINIQKEIQPQ